SRNADLSPRGRALATQLRRDWNCDYDDAGAIGRRYRRQDEIGTPFCVTLDFETPTDQAVTVRERDTMKPERVSLERVPGYPPAPWWPSTPTNTRAACSSTARTRPRSAPRCAWWWPRTWPTTSTSTSAAPYPRSPARAAARRCPSSARCSAGSSPRRWRGRTAV